MRRNPRTLGPMGVFALAVMATIPHDAAVAEPVATEYVDGVSAPCTGCIFGKMQVVGETPSVGNGGFGADGNELNGRRVYMWDRQATQDLTDGAAKRGDDGFSMMIWDFTRPLNTIRLYTHQDHYGGGAVGSDFVAQDLMEYSVWGSHDGHGFVLLSDVVDYEIHGGGTGLPTYTFAGTAPSVIFRGGSSEFGVTNAYTRDYTFETAYRYFGIRTSTISLTFPGGPDADPEIDAIAGHAGPIAGVTPGEPELGGRGILLARVERRTGSIPGPQKSDPKPKWED